jgi:hypothetical protein
MDQNTRPNIAEPLAVLAGGERSVIIKTAALLYFVGMKESTVLRLVSSEFRDAIAAFPWGDQALTFIAHSHILHWRFCFPNARAAILINTSVPSSAFQRLQGVEKLNLMFSTFSVAAFVAEHYPRLTCLNLMEKKKKRHGRLTRACLAALQCPLLSTLNLSGCSDITGLMNLQFPLLTSLDLSKCLALTDASLIDLQCPLLASLNLAGCLRITGAALTVFQCPC